MSTKFDTLELRRFDDLRYDFGQTRRLLLELQNILMNDGLPQDANNNNSLSNHMYCGIDESILQNVDFDDDGKPRLQEQVVSRKDITMAEINELKEINIQHRAEKVALQVRLSIQERTITTREETIEQQSSQIGQLLDEIEKRANEYTELLVKLRSEESKVRSLEEQLSKCQCPKLETTTTNKEKTEKIVEDMITETIAQFEEDAPPSDHHIFNFSDDDDEIQRKERPVEEEEELVIPVLPGDFLLKESERMIEERRKMSSTLHSMQRQIRSDDPVQRLLVHMERRMDRFMDMLGIIESQHLYPNDVDGGSSDSGFVNGGYHRHSDSGKLKFVYHI